jgi:predicted Zn-dependent peptidase
MPSADRSRLPTLGPEPAFHFPEIRRGALGNGVRLVTVEHREVPVVSLLVLVPFGAAADSPDRPGLAAITGDLLDEGCGDLDALGLHDRLGRIGAQLDTEVGADATLLGITVLERFGSRALELLADIVMRPRLERHEFERVRDLRLNRLVQLRDVPTALAERAFVSVLYPQHPYGHLPLGTEASLRAMSVEQVRQFHADAYRPSNVTVIAVGDASHERLATMVEGAFGSWTTGHDVSSASIDGDVSAVPPPPSERIRIVHRPAAAQSELRIGHVSVPRSTADYHSLLVLNLVLGGQFVSRINMNLREDKGYTYGARTAFSFRRGPGPFVLQASVQADATGDAVRESLMELAAIRGERPVTRKELEVGRAGLTRGYPRHFETADQLARASAQLVLYDLPDDHYTTFVPSVLSLTEADITDAARRHIKPGHLATIVVGDRDKAGAQLERLGLGEVTELKPDF